MNNLPRIGIPLLVALTLGLLLFSKSIVTIGSGEAGVVYKLFGGGVVTDQPPLSEGFHIILPWNNVIKYEVRQQPETLSMKVLSVDGLDIKIDVTALYQPSYKDLGKLHQEIGQSYKTRVLLPAIKSATRGVIGRYTPDELYASKRDAIEEEILNETRLIIDGEYVQLNEVLVEEITLPSSIVQAIERKKAAERQSEEYEYRLEIAAKEAERQKTEAQGKADANDILSRSLNTLILKDKGIEATLKLAESNNTKVIVIGSSKDGLPLILGNN